MRQAPGASSRTPHQDVVVSPCVSVSPDLPDHALYNSCDGLTLNVASNLKKLVGNDNPTAREEETTSGRQGETVHFTLAPLVLQMGNNIRSSSHECKQVIGGTRSKTRERKTGHVILGPPGEIFNALLASECPPAPCLPFASTMRCFGGLLLPLGGQDPGPGSGQASLAQRDTRGLRTGDRRQQTADKRQQTADRRQQTADSRQADSRQQTADSRQADSSTADSRQQTADSRQQTADSRQQTAGGRQQTAGGRRQTADGQGGSRQQTSRQAARRPQTADGRRQTAERTADGRGQRAEDTWQTADGRRQAADGRRQTADDADGRRQTADGRRQTAGRQTAGRGDGRRRGGGGGARSAWDGRQPPVARGQRTEASGQANVPAASGKRPAASGQGELRMHVSCLFPSIGPVQVLFSLVS